MNIWKYMSADEIIRVREEELVYILNKLLVLRLWPGSLWAALSDDPSRHCIELPGALLGIDHNPNREITHTFIRRTIKFVCCRSLRRGS